MTLSEGTIWYIVGIPTGLVTGLGSAYIYDRGSRAWKDWRRKTEEARARNDQAALLDAAIELAEAGAAGSSSVRFLPQSSVVAAEAAGRLRSSVVTRRVRSSDHSELQTLADNLRAAKQTTVEDGWDDDGERVGEDGGTYNINDRSPIAVNRYLGSVEGSELVLVNSEGERGGSSTWPVVDSNSY
jgi:hypothetical protein